MARTGIMAVATPPQMTAYELWREQVNAAGGLDVGGDEAPGRVRRATTTSPSPSKAVQIYEKLITDDKVDLLLAPWGTPFHIAIAPVLEKYKFPVVGNTAASVALRQIKPGYHLVSDLGDPRPASAIELTAMMKAPNVKSAAIIVQRAAVRQGDQELPGARAEEGRHRDRGDDGVSAGRQGHDRDC